MMRLAIITALHERYRLTELFLRYYSDLDVEGVDLGLFCAVTNNDYAMHGVVSKYPKWNVVYASNRPLTFKFKANMDGVKEWNPDALMILGSDNFVDAEYILGGLDRLNHADFVGTKSLYYLNLGTDEVIKQWDLHGRPIGAGRIVSRELLSYCKWNLWNPGDNRLDGSMYDRLQWKGILPDFVDRGTLLDVKAKDEDGTETNQTPWSTVRRWPHQSVNGRVYLEKHFPSISGELLNW